MQRLQAVGLVLLIGGLAAYVAGAYVAYEGRSFSLTAIMVGFALVATGGVE